MQDLDAKDRKLLYELDCNSRQTIQQLARKIGLSKDGIKYRIAKLTESGIIKSFNAVIDTGKLGFYSFRIFLKFSHTSPSKEKEILDFLLKNKNLVWLVQVAGAWDVNTWFLYKSIEEMNAFWEGLLERYRDYFSRREFAVYAQVTYFSRGYLLEKKETQFMLPVISLPAEAKLDAGDLRIVELLANDARMPIVRLAAKAKLTPKTVIAKIRRLEKEKIIVGYRAELDLEKLGFQYYKLHFSLFNCAPEKLKRMEQHVRHHPNIVFEDKVLGGHDLELEVQVKSEEEMRALVGQFRETFSESVKEVEVLHYFKEHRLRFFPSLE